MIIFIINFIFQKILEQLTKSENQRSYTKYYLSFSVKLTIFTFLNSAFFPLICNYIEFDCVYDNLNNNMFMIFLVNVIVPPFLWLFIFIIILY